MEKEPNKFQRFFWWGTGANRALLERFPNEWGRQTASGIFVFIVALMATFAMFGVLAGVIKINTIPAIIGALFWGFTILSLDRVFLTNYRKGKNEFWRAFYRIAVTIVCSLLITDMAMLSLLKGDIDAKIELRKVNDQNEIKRNVLTPVEHEEMAQLMASEVDLQSKLDRLTQDVQEKMEIRDAEGRGDKTYHRSDGSEVQLSGKPSHAREFDERNKEFVSAKEALDAQLDENKSGSLANNLKRIRDRETKLTERQDNAGQKLHDTQETTRLLEMHNALSEILWDEKSKGALYSFILLWLVLILLESAPILQKLTSRKSQYEDALNVDDNRADESEKFHLASAKSISRVYESLETNSALNLSPKEDDLKQYVETLIVRKHKTDIEHEWRSAQQLPIFGKQIILRVAGDENLSGNMRIPSNIERKIYFDDLVAEVEAMEEKVRLKKGDVQLVKVTNSAGIVIDRDFTPLISQIEDDGIIVLHFEPTPQSKNVTT